jgi:hypothetical protein
MKRVARDEELQLFPAAQVRADDDALGRAVAVQQQDLERIAELVVVELIVAASAVSSSAIRASFGHSRGSWFRER